MNLKELIAQRQVESQRRRRELELFDAETRGMIAAFDLSGEQSDAIQIPKKSDWGFVAKRGGRQPGAISHEWRMILADLYKFRSWGFDVNQVISAASAQGIAIKAADAQARMEKYKEHNFVESFGAHRYRVTNVAAEKFKFGTANESGPDVETAVPDQEESLI